MTGHDDHEHGAHPPHLKHRYVVYAVNLLSGKFLSHNPRIDKSLTFLLFSHAHEEDIPGTVNLQAQGTNRHFFLKPKRTLLRERQLLTHFSRGR